MYTLEIKHLLIIINRLRRLIKMKSLGIVGKVDELGRIVLPIETRKRLDLGPENSVEIFVEKEQSCTEEVRAPPDFLRRR